MKNDLASRLKFYRISQIEYEKIKELLGREPKDIEWPLFSALWSEHCSYKSSKIHLKKFAQTLNSSVVNASGENAGVVDLGKGERIAFKMESHNHPSFIEPYQGAATGVGGILRDIFTMGARPIASANYLCFGEPQAERMTALVNGVVQGISGYGNCVGVPTVTGQTNFDSSYNKNILVNAMSVGLFRPGEKIALSAAKGPGNLVVYVGAKTGKDGVHGAAMASESFEKDSESKKPNVQIGDPYFEKLLIESCREVLQKDLVVAIQDMGAAGLTSSSFEMASKGQVGMKIHLDLVPVRDSSITPEEILLSESQERMLLVCELEKISEIKSVFAKQGLDAAVIGEVIEKRVVGLYWQSELLTQIDPDLLVENAPVYERPYEKWQERNHVTDVMAFPEIKQELQNYIKDHLAKPEFGSRKAIYQQYDQRVGARTARGAAHDIAFLRLPDSGRGLALAAGCRPTVMKMDARLGALDAVFYPSLQMAIKGAKALAVTDCLNFGNPEKLKIMTEFVASVDAIVEAAKILNTPVVSGNVSFYNETLGVNITSTPATGIVGLRETVTNIPEDYFVKARHDVLSLRLKNNVSFAGKFTGSFDLGKAAQFIRELQEICLSENVLSSQVIGEAGLAVGLAKMTQGKVGFVNSAKLPVSRWLHQHFYEVVLEVKNKEAILDFIKDRMAELNEDVEILELGTTNEDRFEIQNYISASVKDLNKLYDSALNELIPTGVTL